MLPPPMKVVAIAKVSRASRAPKIAVPTRTSVAPSAIASSRSADIPIDSVSTGRPASRQASKHSRSTRNCARRTPASDVGSGMPMMPRSRSPGSAATIVAEITASAGATPLFDASPLALTWMQTSSGGVPAGRAAESRARDLLPVDGLHPGERRAAATAALLLCNGPIEVPVDVGEIGETGHLRGTLLHVVFAEFPLAERVDRPHGLGRERLADGDKPHAFGVAPAGSRRAGNPRAHVLPRLLVVEHNRMTLACGRRFGTRIACPMSSSSAESGAPGIADRTRDYRWTSPNFWHSQSRTRRPTCTCRPGCRR